MRFFCIIHSADKSLKCLSVCQELLDIGFAMVNKGLRENHENWEDLSKELKLKLKFKKAMAAVCRPETVRPSNDLHHQKIFNIEYLMSLGG